MRRDLAEPFDAAVLHPHVWVEVRRRAADWNIGRVVRVQIKGASYDLSSVDAPLGPG